MDLLAGDGTNAERPGLLPSLAEVLEGTEQRLHGEYGSVGVLLSTVA
ncbi:MAG: hypothetical protein ACQEXJ_17450 [Myxococcota bacterium]